MFEKSPQLMGLFLKAFPKLKKLLTLLSHMSYLVSEENNVSLMKSFTEEEIRNVVWDMESDKAPGPDGFYFHFYKVCWNIIKTDLLIMVKSF